MVFHVLQWIGSFRRERICFLLENILNSFYCDKTVKEKYHHMHTRYQINRRIKRQCLHPYQDYAIKKSAAAVGGESDIKQDHMEIVWAEEKSLTSQMDQWILLVDKLHSLGTWVNTNEGRKAKIERSRGRGLCSNPNLYNCMEKTHRELRSTAIYIVKEKKTDISLVLLCTNGNGRLLRALSLSQI